MAEATKTDGNEKPVDHAALRVNQAWISGLLLAGFLLGQIWPVWLVTIVMLAGTVTPALALFQRTYRDGLRPLGWLRPDERHEDPRPHRFAQGLGGGVLCLALVAFGVGQVLLGWGLVLVVVVLAVVNLVFGFCAGCFIFFQVQRIRSGVRHA